MSCRVLKREMEIAMLDTLVEHACAAGIERILGYYLRTAKNAMVEDHFGKLGFTLLESSEDGNRSVWSLPVSFYSRKTKHIQLRTLVHG
jgi:predicted enzyme involved in methoxymalonyl-ACP biosynthesis